MHHNLTFVHLLYIHAITDTRYVHTMIDTWLYIWLITVCFYYCSSMYCIVIVFTVYWLLLYYILLFSHFTYSLEVFWLPWICISRSRIISSCWLDIWRGSHVLRGAQSFPLRDYLVGILLMSSLFILVNSFDSL